MAVYTPEELTRMADELLRNDTMGAEILRCGCNNSVGGGLEYGVINHKSGLGEGELHYFVENGKAIIGSVEAEPPRNGVFTIMLSDLEEKAREKGVKTLELDVAVDNSEAQKAYRARGFYSCGEGPEGCIAMRKDLSYSE